MAEDVFALFDEYAARFARGERPDARAYLARAGGGADELGRLIEGYLERAPAPPPDEDARLLSEAWLSGQPPLLELRTRRALTRDEVVDALIGTLSLDRAKRAKVKRYYRQLETGLLDPGRVDRTVFEALGEVLRARMENLRAWRPRPQHFEPAYLRVPSRPRAAAAAPEPPARAPTEPPDEIDRLFTAGSH